MGELILLGKLIDLGWEFFYVMRPILNCTQCLPGSQWSFFSWGGMRENLVERGTTLQSPISRIPLKGSSVAVTASIPKVIHVQSLPSHKHNDRLFRGKSSFTECGSVADGAAKTQTRIKQGISTSNGFLILNYGRSTGGISLHPLWMIRCPPQIF